MLKKVLAIFIILTFCSCYSIRVDRQAAGMDPVEHLQNFYFLGLIGDREVNLADECPRGVSAFNEKATFGNIIASILTIGIYTPRTVIINCAT